MEEKCSIGIILNLNCNIRKNRKNLKIDVEDLSLLECELLKIINQVFIKQLWKNSDYIVYLIKFYGDNNCFCCKHNVFVEKKEYENVDIEHLNENEVMGTDEISQETANDIINKSLEMLE